MSQANVELVRTILEDFFADKSEFAADGTLTKLAGEELLHPEIDWDATEIPIPDICGTYLGMAEVRSFWNQWLGAWESIRADYELLDAGDRVLVLLDQRMRGRTTGLDFPIVYAQLFTLRDGLVVHWKFYVDQAAALAAGGLARDKAETVRRALNALLQEDWDAAVADLSPDAEIVDHDIPDADVYRGPEGFLEWVARWGESWESWTVEDVEIRTGTEDRVVRIDYFNNQQQALEAAGLSDAD